jgi:hypothetical protein
MCVNGCGGSKHAGAGLSSPSRVSPLAAEEYSPALSVEITVPPRRVMADSKDRRVCVDGS